MAWSGSALARLSEFGLCSPFEQAEPYLRELHFRTNLFLWLLEDIEAMQNFPAASLHFSPGIGKRPSFMA
jgi:hypothetical protein